MSEPPQHSVSREQATRPPERLDRARIAEAARELAERTALEQGLPARVTDRQTLARVAAILRATSS